MTPPIDLTALKKLIADVEAERVRGIKGTLRIGSKSGWWQSVVDDTGTVANVHSHVAAAYFAALDPATVAALIACHDALKEVEIHCPCGARPESLHTHPHVAGCPVGKALAPFTTEEKS